MGSVTELQAERRRLSLSTARRGFKYLTTLGYPRRFPVVQFPNLPLIIGLTSGYAARHVHGIGHDYLMAAAYSAMTIWAYEEMTRGTNWVRRLLGVVFMVILVLKIARGLRG